MRASRFPNTDEKSRVNTMPMAAPLRGGGARARVSSRRWWLWGREIYNGKGRSGASELARASAEDEDLPHFFSPIGETCFRDLERLAVFGTEVGEQKMSGTARSTFH